MKIVLCTTPIRPVPTDYPPFGSLALIQALRRAGFDPYFYDIDCLRPSFDQIEEFFRREKPDVVAVSAVVSTAYAFTKRLSLALKRIRPEAVVVVGGNLSASAVILHRLAQVDVCVAGEGERILANLCRVLERLGRPLDREALKQVKGITFLDGRGDMVFTGFEEPIPAAEFEEPDFSILERYSRIDHFIGDPLTRVDFMRDPRTYEPHRRGQRMTTVQSAKGCVARCTFCHRWDKGYRHFPAEAIVRRMRFLKTRYNVGFFHFGDENFGSDRKELEELIRLVKPLDVLYVVGGVRCRSVDPDLLRRLKDSGCVALYYGMETGSPRILQVMEKNASLEHNIRAAEWTREAGLYTVFQFVLAMPGETNETVLETLEFAKKVTERLPEPPHKYLSINYIQALPGTPVYEYARHRGFIGSSLEEEEKYLMMVSDVDAADDTKFINFTQEDYFTVQHWRHRILFEAEAHWYRVRGWRPAEYRLPSGVAPTAHGSEDNMAEGKDYYTEGGYFNVKRAVHNPLFYRYGSPLRAFYYAGYVLAKNFARLPFALFLRYLRDFVVNRFRKGPSLTDYRSLRRIMKETAPPPASPSEESMLPLRLGR